VGLAVGAASAAEAQLTMQMSNGWAFTFSGNVNAFAIYQSNDEDGGTLAAPAWTGFMREVYRRRPAPGSGRSSSNCAERGRPVIGEARRVGPPALGAGELGEGAAGLPPRRAPRQQQQPSPDRDEIAGSFVRDHGASQPQGNPLEVANFIGKPNTHDWQYEKQNQPNNSFQTPRGQHNEKQIETRNHA
jgi:hypothetical protein